MDSPFYHEVSQSAWKELEDTLLSNNLIDMNLILNGDFNSRIGCKKDYIENNNNNIPELREFDAIFENDSVIRRQSCDEIANNTGKELLRFCKTYGCLVLNGRFGKDSNVGEYTFINQNGCSVIDYFILSRSLINLIADFDVVSRPESCHLPLSMDLKGVCHFSKNGNNDSVHCTYYNWNTDTNVIYADNVNAYVLAGYFDELDLLIDDDEADVNGVLNAFENVLRQCSEDLKRTKRKSHTVFNKSWFDAACKIAKLKAVKSLKLFRTSRCVHDLKAYIRDKKSFKNMCKSKRRAYERLYLSKIEGSVNNTKLFWKQIKNLTKKQNIQPDISTVQWYDHFSSLLSVGENDESSMNNDAINTDTGGSADFDILQNIVFNSPITDDEIIEVVHRLNCKKSVAGDILPQHFKYAFPAILPYMRKFMNRLFEKGEFPESWTKCVLVPIHKKGNVNSPDNYRGIALLETFSKIYISVLTNRITFFTEAFSKITESQAGFRAGYSTIDNAFVLYSIISKYFNMKHKFVYVAFIDFKKAFDSINRDILFNILRKQGIKGNLYNAVKSIYNSVKTSVKSCSGFSNSFNCPMGLRQGCSLSPILFSMFINELNDIMVESGVRGIQMFPHLVEIFLLMFADDIACISDTISGLQKELNILNNYCQTYKLKVNVEKTKVLVFKKGGQLSRREKWYFDGNQLEVVNSFSYVGVDFTNRLSLYKMAESMSNKAQRVLAHLFSSFSELSYLPAKTFFKVFDAKVCTVMLYGSEIWGLKYMSCIENIQLYACKRLLGVNLWSCNDAILGDLGRFPMYIFSVKRCLSYWLRLLKLPDTRYVKLCYNMLKYYDSIGHKNWVSDVKHVLYSKGYGFIWESQNVSDEKKILLNFVNRLKDQYIQNWRSNLETNHKLNYYKDFKQIFCQEIYITAIDISKFRKALAMFRSSSHTLMIERGRHFNISRDFRNCVYCECYIEDEFHFLMVCPLYENLRKEYLPVYYTQNRNRHNFINLMQTGNTQIIRNMAMFLYYAFKQRHEFLSGEE